MLFKERALKHGTSIMKSRSNSPFASPRPVASPRSVPQRTLGFHSHEPTGPDYTSLLNDEILLQVFSKVPVSHHVSSSLVCKRWLFIHGRLVQSIKEGKAFVIGRVLIADDRLFGVGYSELEGT
ncbi:hypothetical protein Peur_022670 [Populus x canadensis]